MSEISTEELAQWLEYISQWTLQHASEKNSVYHLPVDVVDIAKISQAAARLRALVEDAERLPTSGFYMEDARSRVGNDMLWWRKGAKGYTTDLREAEVYQEHELNGFRDTDRPWPVEYINSRARPAVDFQHCDYSAIDKARHD